MEYASGGELFDFIVQNTRLSLWENHLLEWRNSKLASSCTKSFPGSSIFTRWASFTATSSLRIFCSHHSKISWSLTSDSVINTRNLRHSRLLAEALAMRRQKWSQGGPTMAWKLIFGVVESSCTLYSAGTCHLKIRILRFSTKKFSLLISIFRVLCQLMRRIF